MNQNRTTVRWFKAGPPGTPLLILARCPQERKCDVRGHHRTRGPYRFSPSRRRPHSLGAANREPVSCVSCRTPRRNRRNVALFVLILILFILLSVCFYTNKSNILNPPATSYKNVMIVDANESYTAAHIPQLS